MSTHKLIQLNSNGTQQEYVGKASSAGAGDSGEFIIADSSGKIDTSFLPNGVGADAITATAGEGLAAGDFVYISGAGTVFKADATTLAKAARGYVLTSVISAASATIYFDESNTSVSALTPGSTYYLSATPGGVTTTPPSGSSQIVQELGFATSATSLHVNIQLPITRA